MTEHKYRACTVYANTLINLYRSIEVIRDTNNKTTRAQDSHDELDEVINIARCIAYEALNEAFDKDKVKELTAKNKAHA